MTAMIWIIFLIVGWKPIVLTSARAGVNTMSAMLAGINGKAVPWGGAKLKYAEARRQYRKLTVLDGKRNDVILGDFS